LNFFDVDVQVSAAEFSVGTSRLAPMSVRATLAGGMLKATFPKIGLYGGQGDGLFLVGSFDAVPNLAARVNVNGVRAAELLTEVADFDAVDGSMQAAIDIHASGASPRAIMAALSGSIDILIQDGEVRSINIAKMIRTLMGTPLTGWSASAAEKTDLSQFSARFLVSNGKATTDNLQLMGPLVRVSGAGTADIASKTLQFRIDPKLVMTLEGQGGRADPLGLGVPVIVEGTWGEPQIYPDIAGILDNPNSAYAQLRALGKGLFGSNPQAGAGIDALIQGVDNLFGTPNKDRKDSNNSAARQRRPDSPNAPAQNLDFLRNLFGR
jgi:AsmA protein